MLEGKWAENKHKPVNLCLVQLIKNEEQINVGILLFDLFVYSVLAITQH